MKKLKVSLTALALTAGVAGAFAANSHGPQKLADADYTWTKPGSPQFVGTVTEAQDNYDCHGSNITCATGVIVPGSGEGNLTETIFEND